MKTNLFILPFVVLASTMSAASPLPKKLIQTGWDTPDTAQFRRDLPAMEQWPFDGVVVSAQGRAPDGTAFDAKPAFSTNHWERTAFTGALADLQAARSTRLTDNFLILLANPGNVDWFDDAGWKEIVAHWRLLARLAHEGRLKGLLFDPEPYTGPFKQFKYAAQPQRAQHSFAEYQQKARERGREVMRAVAAEFPDAVIYSYFLFGECARALSTGDPQARLASESYGLLPAFTDGWLDVLPPTVTLIDGNERAYRYNSEAAFNAAFVQIKNDCQAFVSPENRAKFRAQLQVSHGIYLDAYVNPPGSSWFIDGLGGPRVNRLEANVAAALHTADEYVWVYGERGRWWPPRQAGPKTPPTWPERLPGVESALKNARDSWGAAPRRPAGSR